MDKYKKDINNQIEDLFKDMPINRFKNLAVEMINNSSNQEKLANVFFNLWKITQGKLLKE